MNVFEYLAAESERAERQRAQMAGSVKRHWLVLLALIFGVVGAVFFGLFFRSERTETESSGHLWWKDETTTTTEIPFGTRLVFLLVGLALLALAALCVYVRIKQARRRAAQRKYLAILTGVERMKIHQIAAITGASQATVYRDLQRMIDIGVVEDIHIDFQAEEVVSKRYVPKTSHKTVVACRACHAHNEVIVGITRPCVACGEPLVLNAQ
ncbi:hypothetical protein [Pimelobacter simplex]|uniref:hypothetical protein n=1 Tax=Nocardioides simplex TaxID=2045 RepID=UPI00214FE4B6|nr:hypothetical protein [Pimelobacter simplex]UUW87772.1 hypothetical protein M0M43_18730 [Pimelobacter simplex]UUW97277.1 hypothetical protein M0M48_07380 [Pimelobacter simplex]